MQLLRTLSLLLLILALFSCRKDPGLLTDSSAKLGFSEDTVMFDTVFTSVGSITKRFKIYNGNSKRLNISSVRLGRGASSMFRLNVDGRPGSEIKNVEIEGKDSLFVFVEVTIDPNNGTTPLVVSDSILFNTNGNLQKVQLVAWGQDAYFHVAAEGGLRAFLVDTVNANIFWNNKKPHVVYGLGVVGRDQSLTIQEGANIYFHRSSGLAVDSAGSLKVQGTQAKPVTFQGDRLGVDYSDVPFQWDRIWLAAGSRDNKIDYAVIKNGNIGILVDTVANSSPTLEISNTIIKNMGSYGIAARGATVRAANCVIADCGESLALLIIGGDYQFIHCTFANYWLGTRQTPSLVLNNYYEDVNGNIQNRALVKADFLNCIVHGNLENEIGFDSSPGAAFNYRFDHALIKIDPATDTSDPNRFRNILKNPSVTSDTTIFRAYYSGNFELSNSSVGIDKGDPAISASVPLDIKGVPRTSAPDLGAYERK